MCWCFPFFSSPTPSPSIPQLEKINYTEEWNGITIRNNIKAVPYSENLEKLSKLKEVVAFYKENLAHKHSENWRKHHLSLLQELDSLTDRRLKEIPYVNAINSTVNMINRIKKDPNDLRDSDIVTRMTDEECIQELEKTRKQLTHYDKEIISLNKKLQSYSKVYVSCQERLKLLNSLHKKAANARELLSSKDHPDNAEVSTKKDKKDSTSLPWDVSKIKVKEESIPKMNGDKLSALIEKIRIQKTTCQKEMRLPAEELKWLHRSHDLLTESLTLLQQLAQKLNEKVMKSIFSNVRTYQSDLAIELNNFDQEPLHKHEIKGATCKTYVALTEQNNDDKSSII